MFPSESVSATLAIKFLYLCHSPLELGTLTVQDLDVELEAPMLKLAIWQLEFASTITVQQLMAVINDVAEIYRNKQIIVLLTMLSCVEAANDRSTPATWCRDAEHVGNTIADGSA
jgi:hypothetical protein